MVFKVLAVATAMAIPGLAYGSSMTSTRETMTYHRVNVDGINIFYREAGPKDAPTILMLHGFPSSSRMFDPLIPLLADRYSPRIIPASATATRLYRQNIPTRSIIWLKQRPS